MTKLNLARARVFPMCVRVRQFYAVTTRAMSLTRVNSSAAMPMMPPRIRGWDTSPLKGYRARASNTQVSPDLHLILSILEGKHYPFGH